jgi:cytochrome c
MDSFEINKILGALLFTCLVTLSLNIAAGAVFTPKKLAKPGYEIAVPEQGAGGGQEAAKEPEQPIATVLASADPKRGENAAKKCVSCHTFAKGEPNKVGPNLWGVINRPKGSAAGFNYSAAMKSKGGNWTLEELYHYLANPKAMVPGTTMNFPGIPRSSERGDVIAFLNAHSDSPQDLTKAADAGPNGGAARLAQRR